MIMFQTTDAIVGSSWDFTRGLLSKPFHLKLTLRKPVYQILDFTALCTIQVGISHEQNVRPSVYPPVYQTREL